MLAHGFTIEQMVELVRTGLATATVERIVAGGARVGEVGRASHLKLSLDQSADPALNRIARQLVAAEQDK